MSTECSCLSDLEGSLPKLYFTRKYTDRPSRRFNIGNIGKYRGKRPIMTTMGRKIPLSTSFNGFHYEERSREPIGTGAGFGRPESVSTRESRIAEAVDRSTYQPAGNKKALHETEEEYRG